MPVFIEISVFIGIFVVSNFIGMECVYSTCISTVFIEHLCIYLYIYIYIYSYLLDWILFSFIQYMYSKIY